MLQNPEDSASAQTLLGLLHLNRSRDPLLPGGSKTRQKAYELGLSLVNQAFKKDNTIAACMGPLGNHLLLQNQGDKVWIFVSLFLPIAQLSLTTSVAASTR